MNKGELFLIQEDISEKNNLSDQYPEIVDKLDSMISEFHKMQPVKEIETQPQNWSPPENWTMPGQIIKRLMLK